MDDVCIWITGLSGSGKSTIANALRLSMTMERIDCHVLDGDELRAGLNCNLGFHGDDVTENTRRITHVARILADAGIIPVVACISPRRKHREYARSLFPNDGFIEVHVATSLDTCQKRDTKGLYRKFEAGEIAYLAGVDVVYEPPEHPEVIVCESNSVDGAVRKIMDAFFISLAS